MLASGVIEASSSPYSSPIVMAPKNDGKFRFCVDFRRLNGIMEDSAQPLPVIYEVLKDLGEATIFSTLNLRSGYWQIPLTDRAKKYTGFCHTGRWTIRLQPPSGSKGREGRARSSSAGRSTSNTWHWFSRALARMG
jgi:hypothetical protein